MCQEVREESVAGFDCRTLQHAATHGNTLQHTATHCNTLQYIATGEGVRDGGDAGSVLEFQPRVCAGGNPK